MEEEVTIAGGCLPLLLKAEELNSQVARRFPPHPCAVAPSSELDVDKALPFGCRSALARDWHSTKRKAAAKYQRKNK